MQQSYDLPKETAAAVIMLYKNTKAILPSPDGDTKFFALLLQGDILALSVFLIRLDYALRTSKNLI